jgi:hypothetical protein
MQARHPASEAAFAGDAGRTAAVGGAMPSGMIDRVLVRRQGAVPRNVPVEPVDDGAPYIRRLRGPRRRT